MNANLFFLMMQLQINRTYLEDFKNAIEKSKADIISCNYVVEKNNGSRLKNYVFSDNCNQNFLNILSDLLNINFLFFTNGLLS